MTQFAIQNWHSSIQNWALQFEIYRWTVVPSIKADGEETRQSSYTTNRV